MSYASNGISVGEVGLERGVSINEMAYLPADPANRVGMTSPEKAAEVFRPFYEGLDREACVVAHLDTKYRLLATEVISIGSAANTFMAPREVFRGALIHGATALITSHNHPSGDASPSDDDLAIARRLDRAGQLLGVELLDSIVMGFGGRWVSLARRGALD